MSTAPDICLGDWTALGKAAYAIRLRVFVHEQGVPLEMEQDEFDADAVHVIASLNAIPVGTARLLMPGADLGSIGRVAVLEQWRGRGIGMAMMDALIARARRLGLHAVELHAQISAADFYVQQGFAAISEVFVDAGIPHVSMRLPLR